MTVREQSRNSAGPAALVFGISFIVQFFAMTRQITKYDEGLELFAAVRVLHGDVLYRDFWAMYGPAQFYVLAALFRIFGVSVLVARTYHVFCGSCLVLVLYLLVRTLTTTRIAVLSSSLILLWIAGVADITYEFPTYAAASLAFASFLMLVPFLQDDERRFPILLSGLLTGLTTLFRHDFGFYMFLTGSAVILFRGFINSTRQSPKSFPFRTNIAHFGRYFLGMAIIVFPIVGILVLHVPLHDLYYDLIFVPSHIYPRFRSLPFPSAHQLYQWLRQHQFSSEEGVVDYFPGLVFLSFSAYLFLSRNTSAMEDGIDKIERSRLRRLMLALNLLLAFMTLKGFIRVAPVQMIQGIVLAIAILAILYQDIVTTGRKWSVFFYICCLWLVLPTGIVIGNVLRNSIANAENVVGLRLFPTKSSPGGPLLQSCRRPRNLDAMNCFYVDPDEMRAIEFIQARTNEGDTIYVGVPHHDKILLNNVSFYFVSKRMSATKWHDLHPGVQTTAPIQLEMIKDFERTRPRYVLIDSETSDANEPNESRIHSGVNLLDDYIHTHYLPATAYGQYSILQRH